MLLACTGLSLSAVALAHPCHPRRSTAIILRRYPRATSCRAAKTPLSVLCNALQWCSVLRSFAIWLAPIAKHGGAAPLAAASRRRGVAFGGALAGTGTILRHHIALRPTDGEGHGKLLLPRRVPRPPRDQGQHDGGSGSRASPVRRRKHGRSRTQRPQPECSHLGN